MFFRLLARMTDRELNYGRSILQQFVRRLPEDPTCVVDIGAGTGEDLAICQSHLPHAVFHAIECYPPNAEQLQKRGIHTYALNLEQAPFPFSENSVDLLLANQILEHCKEIFWIFHEISRTVKVGGYVYVGVPNLASIHSRLLLLTGRHPTAIRAAGPHVRGFTRADLTHFLRTCAPSLYAIEAVKGSGFYPFPPALARPLARLFPNGATCIFLILKKVRAYDSEFLRYPIGLQTNYWLGNTE